MTTRGSGSAPARCLGILVTALALGWATPMVTAAGAQSMERDPCRERFTVWTAELVRRSEIKVMQSFDAYKAKIQELAIKASQLEWSFANQNKLDAVTQLQTDRQFLQAQLDAMPHMSQTVSQGGSGGFYPIYLCQVQDYVTRPRFRTEVDRMREIEKRLTDYTGQLAGLEQRGASQFGSTSTEQYSVFRADKHVLVGQIDSLKDVPACRLKGWGTNCEKKVGDLVRLVNVGPNFNSFEEARRWYCAALKPDTIKVVPLTGGRDRSAQFSFSDEPLYIQNAPSCAAR
jgi:hypothetical protein